MDEFESHARRNQFVRYIALSPHENTRYVEFQCIPWRIGDVSALTRENLPGIVAQGKQGCHTESGARPGYYYRQFRYFFSRQDFLKIVSGMLRHRSGHGGEIIDDFNVIKAKHLAEVPG